MRPPISGVDLTELAVRDPRSSRWMTGREKSINADSLLLDKTLCEPRKNCS